MKKFLWIALLALIALPFAVLATEGEQEELTGTILEIHRAGDGSVDHLIVLERDDDDDDDGDDDGDDTNDRVRVVFQDTTRVFDGPNNPVAPGILTVGQTVRVRGIEMADHGTDDQVLATDVIVLPSGGGGGGVGQHTELNGTIQSITGTTLVLRQENAVLTTVDFATARIYRRPGVPGTAADLVVGQRVRVRGTRQADGSVVATDVILKRGGGDDDGDGDGDNDSVSGRITAVVRDASGGGTLTVSDDDATAPVTVSFTATTRVFRQRGEPATTADLAVGQKIKARGSLNAATGVFQATDIVIRRN